LQGLSGSNGIKGEAGAPGQDVSWLCNCVDPF